MKFSLSVVVFAGCVAAAPVHAAWELPPLDKVLNYQPKQPLQVLTADGVEIAQFGAERRQFLPIAQMPLRLQQAVIAVEDARFREHAGIDPKGMARAALALLTGGRRQGASTITQQVARTFFLTHRFSAERKLQEIRIALEIEKRLSKDRILELYLNEIFLGQRAYGFAAASQVYFGKPLDRLSLAETAMLAGLPQNPHFANPIANFERATQRQRTVLERLRETGVISAAQQAAARAEKLTIRPAGQVSLHAEHVAEMARKVVVDRFGTEAYSRGLRVVTSLRANEQQAAHAALRKAVLAHDRKSAWRGPEASETLPATDGPELERAAAAALKDHRDDDLLRVAIVLSATPKQVRVQLASGERVAVSGDGLRWVQPALAPKARKPLLLQRGAIVRLLSVEGAGAKGAPFEWAISQWPEVEAAFVALDPATGRVRALVGGFDFTAQPFNHVTQAWRQPGSAFKPLLYSAALEHGVMPATLIDDAPFSGANGWQPQNSDGRFDGELSLREALTRSKNLVSVRLLQQLGTPAVRDWATRFGLDAARQPDSLTLALGSGSVTPLQMAQAYAVFANGGWRVEPLLVERITDAQGKLLYAAPPPVPLVDTARAIPARNAFVMDSLLNQVARSGTAARAQRELKRTDVYGKTGTTNDAVDAWFAGFQPGLVAVAWLGHDEPKSLGERETGGGLALPMWIDFMSVALKGRPLQPAATPPEGLLRVNDDWLYSEWAAGDWVERIAADGAVVRAAPLLKPVLPALSVLLPPSPMPAMEQTAR